MFEKMKDEPEEEVQTVSEKKTDPEPTTKTTET